MSKIIFFYDREISSNRLVFEIVIEKFLMKLKMEVAKLVGYKFTVASHLCF